MGQYSGFATESGDDPTGWARARQPSVWIAVLWLSLGLLFDCSEEPADESPSPDAAFGVDAPILDGPTDDADRVEVELPAQSRAYQMGLSAFPPAATVEAEAATWAFIRGQGDLVAVVLDGGVPWHELIDGAPLPEPLESELQRIESELAEHQGGLLLAVDLFSPDRSTIAPDVLGRALPRPLVALQSTASPELRAAYTAYCRGLVERFQPDYFAPLLDLNLYWQNRPSDYDQAVDFYKALREELKALRVETQIFPTWDLDALIAAEEEGVEAFLQVRLIDANVDRLGLSLHPASALVSAASLDSAYLRQVESASTRQLVVVSAGYPSVGFEAGSAAFPSSENAQHNFLAFLLEEAEAGNVDVVVWQPVYDIGAYLEGLCPGRLANPEAPCENGARFDRYRRLASGGLLAADGRHKPAAELWTRFHQRGYAP